MAEYSACVIYGIIIDKDTADLIGNVVPYILEDTNYHIFEEWCCGETLYLGYKLAEIDLTTTTQSSILMFIEKWNSMSGQSEHFLIQAFVQHTM